MEMIRNSAKALLLSTDGRVLLNRCVTSSGEEYFDLPGGGQHVYETMEEAVVREVLEETGLAVEPVRFAALCEEIFTDPDMRRRYPEYCHRTLHIFLVRAVSDGCAKKPRRTSSRPAASGARRRRRKPCPLCPSSFAGACGRF